MGRTYLLLAVIIAVYIASRLALISFGYSHISHPYFDEPVSGTLTYDLLNDGLRAPLMSYQYEQRSGDMMLESLVMVPLAAVFGHSMVTVKLCALLCTLACMLGWVYLIGRYCGMGAALIFSLMFALPPPMFARLALVGTFSSHHMINQILIIQLICLFRMLEKDTKRAGLLLWFVLGLCAGLGMYAFYSYIIFNAFCVLFLLWRRPSVVCLRGVCALCAGGLIGFVPWLWRTVFYSSGGGSFLMDIFKNISLSAWSFAQTFFHTVPYSLGYGYPTREISLSGTIVALILLVLTIVVVRTALRSPAAVNALLPQGRFAGRGMPVHFFLFAGLFPVFYLVCLTLSPMQVNPLEYWPSIGVFATFAPADVIRGRWMTVLFPFYFALAACALGFIAFRKPRLVRAGAWAAVIAFAALNCVHLSGLLARSDEGKIFLYQGYNFDQHAGRLMLPPRGSGQFIHAEALVSGYPHAYREEACRALGTRLAWNEVFRKGAAEKVTGYLEGIPDEWRDPVVYGLLRIVHSNPEQAAEAWVQALADKYPDVFYKNWGYQVLGYRYYGFLLNRDVLLDNIPASEQFFFKSFLDNFRSGMSSEYEGRFVDRVSDFDERTVERLFMQDINKIPRAYQGTVVQGIGRLIGAEMLFDTLHEVDYPLSSAIGEKFPAALRQSFYKGLGNGFAETLCRYWRRLMPPDAVDCSTYARGLDIEWQRCISLMRALPTPQQALIWEGFVQELDRRSLNENITAFIARKLSMR